MNTELQGLGVWFTGLGLHGVGDGLVLGSLRS